MATVCYSRICRLHSRRLVSRGASIPTGKFLVLCTFMQKLLFLPCVMCFDRLQPNLYTIRAESLYKYMRSHSTTLRDATDEELFAAVKKFLAEYVVNRAQGDGGYGAGAGGSESPFRGGRTTFSPKKPKPADSRPAILARRSWSITVDRIRRTVTVGGEFPLVSSIFSFLKLKKNILV